MSDRKAANNMEQEEGAEQCGWLLAPKKRDHAHFFLGVATTLMILFIFKGAGYLYQNIPQEAPILSSQGDLRDLMKKDPTYFWALEPNLSNAEFSGTPDGVQTTYTVSTNSLSLRGPEVTEKGKRFRILAIGDSTTFGQYVNDQETWPAGLQRLLDPSARQVEVINAGLIGASSFQGLCYFIAHGADLQPDLVIISYGFNDCMYGEFSDPERAYLLQSRPIYFYFLSILKGLGVLSSDPNAKERLTPGQYFDTLIALQEKCRSSGAKVLFLIWTGRPDIGLPSPPPEPYRALINEVARRTQSAVLDLWPAFKCAPEPAFIDLIHATPFGNKLAAKSIAAKIEETGIIPPALLNANGNQ